MNQVGETGDPLTYLGTEAKFAYIKDLQSKNLIVPLSATSRARRRFAPSATTFAAAARQ
jgi:hypothetical protein